MSIRIRGRRRVAGLIAFAALAAACTTGTPGSQARTAGSPTPAQPIRSAIGSTELLFAVLESHDASRGTTVTYGTLTPHPHDTIAIVGIDGVARAKASFTSHRVPVVGPAVTILPLEAHPAGRQVFYMDGAGIVRALVVGEEPRQVAAFPLTDPQQEASFAVSPDGQRLIASIIDFGPTQTPSPGAGPFVGPAGPPRETLMMSVDGATTTLGGASGSSRALRMAAWDTTGPIASAGPPTGTQQGPVGLAWGGQAVRLDAAGNAGPQIGGTDCVPVMGLPDGTLLCQPHGSFSSGLSIRDASGSVQWRVPATSSNQFIVSSTLAPDAAHVAYATSFAGGGAVKGRDGSSAALPPGFLPEGWLNRDTIIGSLAISSGDNVFQGDMALVRLADPGLAQDLGFKGTFAGVVQGE